MRPTTCVTPPASPATDMFRRIVTSALLAGAAAGVIAAVLQLVFVQPILLQAEAFEAGGHAHAAGHAEVPHAHPETGGAGPMRDLLSVLFKLLIYCGYALILVPAMAIAGDRGARIDGRTGLIWGIAGFVAVHLAPGFGLAPEVPGVSAADLLARQIWWAVTVAMTAVALWLIAFERGWIAWGAAIVLLLAPHLYGAPVPDTMTGTAPTEIGALFAARALGVGLAAWVMLGGFAGFFWSRGPLTVGAPRPA